MLVEYDIEAGHLWTSFPHFTFTVVENGNCVLVESQAGEVSRYDVTGSESNAERLLRALAILCDTQALTITRGAA